MRTCRNKQRGNYPVEDPETVRHSKHDDKEYLSVQNPEPILLLGNDDLLDFDKRCCFVDEYELFPMIKSGIVINSQEEEDPQKLIPLSPRDSEIATIFMGKWKFTTTGLIIHCKITGGSLDPKTVLGISLCDTAKDEDDTHRGYLKFYQSARIVEYSCLDKAYQQRYNDEGEIAN
ncbi:hypothetical protein BO78DRAFT_413040 [Aspergillus sclerotiicarbonarius CBS 121057]|uniref:Uncharacterized protein n=1 Tax=Aspergillus sclerotiicarbonarius (strain CBS 121057 / IBT 28362) TaxID=1448318 RepID=A0A319ENM5_ASPSB|nr:hypothetical protein BO78DRAFT_413040 [Aspergillus sclerotiicarbonarius CBS 121057]